MEKDRLAAFSDGVIAIIITIMVLELKAPHEPSFAALLALWPVFFSYVLSFVYIAIYWNNHHHLLHAAQRVNGRILWANMHLLFWLSLIPFATAWMAENHFAPTTVAIYGVSLLAPAFAYSLLVLSLLKEHGADSVLGRATGRRAKEWMSLLLYVVGVGLALVEPRLSIAIYVVVALIWLVPDKRIEKEIVARRDAA